MHGMNSLPGQGGDDGVDDHQDENGGDSRDPQIAGVTTLDFTLSPGASRPRVRVALAIPNWATSRLWMKVPIQMWISPSIWDSIVQWVSAISSMWTQIEMVTSHQARARLESRSDLRDPVPRIRTSAALNDHGYGTGHLFILWAELG